MAESLVVEDFHQFGGKHCQTAALKNIEDKVYVSDRAEKNEEYWTGRKKTCEKCRMRLVCPGSAVK